MNFLVTRRHILQGLAASAAMPVVPLAMAATYPNSQSVRWIVPYGAGGGTDIVARILTQHMSNKMGQSFMVDNRPGGNTIIGTQALLSSKPDGFTVMQTAEQIAANAALYPSLKYNAANDLEFVSSLVRTPLVLLAKGSLPIKSPADLLAFMRSKNEAVNYGSWGQGGMNHLTMEAFAAKLGLQPTHIPFTGAAAAIKELLGDNIDLYFSDLGTALPHIEAKKVTPVLVSAKTRIPALPNVPTIHESVFEGFDMYSWQGVLAPKGMPIDAIEQLATAIRDALQTPSVRDDLISRGFFPNPLTPAQFRAQFIESQKLLGDVIRSRGIKIQ